MVEGFEKMKGTKGTRAQVFRQAFPGCDWASSTYYVHLAVWEVVPKDRLSQIVELGHSPGGEWQPLFREFGNK